MSELFEVVVEKREARGKGARLALHERDMIPAVVYGGDRGPVAVAVPRRTVLDILKSDRGMNSLLLFSLKGTKAKRHVMVKDLQTDPVRGNLIHADFMRVVLGETMTVEVPVSILGEAKGVKTEGGYMAIELRSIEVDAAPKDIPDSIEIDVTELSIGQGIHLRDLELPKDVKISGDDLSQMVVHVVSARAEEEEVSTEEAEEEAEVGVVGEEPEEDDEENQS